jgi:hypothetical protein
MRATCVLFVALAVGLTARADFSYTQTTKSAGGMMAAAAPIVTKTYLKGQKMKIDSGDSIMIMDFDAQTLTHINTAQKTYTVSKFSELGETMSKSGMDINIDLKETGQRKTINGFNATEMVMTMEMDNPQARQQGMKMKMEMDIWVSPDVPGAGELRAFYQRNAGKFPWGAMMGAGGRGNASMQKALADLRRKMAEVKGVPVLQVMKMGAAGNEAQMAQMQKGMEQARAQLEEMKKQGKLSPQMEEQLKRMTGASPGGSMFETTMESSNFSSSSIPDSVFAVPAGYQQTERK